MRTEAEITADAADGAPFSNMTSFEVWAANNCGRSSGCRFDGAWGGADESVSCPLITVSLIGRWPVEWPNVEGQPGCCTEYDEIVAHATDDEPLPMDPDSLYERDGWRPVDVLPTQEGLF